MSVSVIIPVCNAQGCLAACLESVLKQTCVPKEIIVVNDGSEDGTVEVVQKYASKIVYLEQANAGPGAARNKGLAVVSGEFVAFLDADDFWKPAFLETCVAFLEAHTECVAVNTGLITRMHDDSEVVQPESLHGPNSPRTPFVLDNFYDFWARHDHVRTGSALIRRSVIDEAGGQRADLRVGEDLEYWGYIATFGRWGYIPEPLWVGNSRSAAAASGWMSKYRKRRKLCPTVETWQKRVLPRLTEEQIPQFETVRGRVAAGYVHNHILGGNPDQAAHILACFGADMPDNRLIRLMKLSRCGGEVGWWLACLAVILREYLKAVLIRFRFTGIMGGS